MAIFVKRPSVFSPTHSTLSFHPAAEGTASVAASRPRVSFRRSSLAPESRSPRRLVYSSVLTHLRQPRARRESPAANFLRTRSGARKIYAGIFRALCLHPYTNIFELLTHTNLEAAHGDEALSSRRIRTHTPADSATLCSCCVTCTS